ncbi:MAG TPA: hypothetical protein VFU19_11840 [Iamia sp.]|nr:hypothetical protein [Iamia sp.]
MVLATVLALGSTAGPAGADPADVHLPLTTWSPQYSLGGCRYKLVYGNYGAAPFVAARFYNLSACGGALVAVTYLNSSGVSVNAVSTAIQTTGTDGCGAFEQILAVGTAPGIGFRGLVWVGTGLRWYASDGLDTQPVHSTC